LLGFKRVICFAVLAAASVAAHAQYFEVDLTSSGFGKFQNVDHNMVNPWGIAYAPGGPFWVSDNGTGVSTVYDSSGTPFPNGNPLVVGIPPGGGNSRPTGIAYNSSGGGFVVTQPDLGEGGGNGSGPSIFIWVTEDGTIAGWNPGVSSQAITAVDNSDFGAVYKGCCMAVNRGHSFLYATDFTRNRVEVFDTQWNMVGTFTDPQAPANYAPFGIANINGFVFVTFAQRAPQVTNGFNGGDDVPGPGHGFVDVFLPNGRFWQRFASRGALNSPWGMAVAPHHFGEFHDRLLIGNFGDGRINVFDLPGGHFRGPLREQVTGHPPIVIPGLWGLIVGNNGLGGSSENVYFTAGPGGESEGLFGYIGAFHGFIG
jgi:uncharacterized protein (TIGR03118 family)